MAVRVKRVTKIMPSSKLTQRPYSISFLKEEVGEAPKPKKIELSPNDNKQDLESPTRKRQQI